VFVTAAREKQSNVVTRKITSGWIEKGRRSAVKVVQGSKCPSVRPDIKRKVSVVDRAAKGEREWINDRRAVHKSSVA
jgi:hypothetical protein